MATITARLTRGRARELLRRLPAVLAGKVPDPTGEVRQLSLLAGMVALSLVKDAYVTKARGGTDDAGLSWAPLAASTLRRRGGSVPAAQSQAPGTGAGTEARQRRGRRAGWSWSGFVRALRRAGKMFARALRGVKGGAGVGRVVQLLVGLLPSGRRGGVAGGGKGRAGAGGEGQKGRGTGGVEILRDTGRLFNSLSPAAVRSDPGAIVIGVNVKYALYHHLGTKGMPARPLWPPPSTWPAAWKQLIVKKVREGVARLAVRFLGGP